MISKVRAFTLKRKFNLRLWTLAVAGVILFSLTTKAEEETSDLVEIRKPWSTEDTYAEGRAAGSWLFGVNMQNYQPTNFSSQVDGVTYAEGFGSNAVHILDFEVGYKRNFRIGSIGAILGYGTGKTTNDISGENREMTIESKSAKLMIALDTIFKEPYVVPYFAFGAYTFGVDENIPNSDIKTSGQTDIGNVMTLGLLFQLDWIEYDLSQKNRHDGLLQNTFLNVFMTKYGGTQSSDDPDTISGWDIGAGLTLEF